MVASPTLSSRANSRVDQCVTPSHAGGGSSVAARIAASSTVLGRPERAASSSPDSRKPSGFRSYESAWRVHVEPRWGRTRVSEIRFTAVQAWVAQLAKKRGPVVVHTACSVLTRIPDDAVRDRLVASNPAWGVKLPKRKPRRNAYLTAE